MSYEQLSILRHTLGIRKPGDRPYRNHFVTAPVSTDYEHCEALVADGLMVKISNGHPLTGGSPCYAATSAGMIAATEPAK